MNAFPAPNSADLAALEQRAASSDAVPLAHLRRSPREKGVVVGGKRQEVTEAKEAGRVLLTMSDASATRQRRVGVPSDLFF